MGSGASVNAARKREHLLWIMMREPTETQGIPFRFWKLHPWRVFGYELIVVKQRG